MAHDPKDNLMPAPHFNDRPDFKEICSKGGKASVIAKKQIKTMKEMMRVLLEEKDNTSKEDRTNLEAVCAAQLKEAINGSTKAAEFIMKSSGNEPEKEIVIKDLRTVPYVLDEEDD